MGEEGPCACERVPWGQEQKGSPGVGCRRPWVCTAVGCPVSLRAHGNERHCVYLGLRRVLGNSLGVFSYGRLVSLWSHWAWRLGLSLRLGSASSGPARGPALLKSQSLFAITDGGFRLCDCSWSLFP